MDLKSIHEIFNNCILRIPSYQRGYAWGNDVPAQAGDSHQNSQVTGQLMDLWSDLQNIPDGRWHYTGLLTLAECTDPDYKWLRKYKQYEIVDGQQRITSVLILITVLIEQADAMGIELGERKGDARFQYLNAHQRDMDVYIFGYDADNPSDKYFRKHILKLDGIEDDSTESSYTENLRKAKAFFTVMVGNQLDHASDPLLALRALFDRVTTDLRFNKYILPTELDPYVVFETMNNRGKGLTELEKLKNRLMYLADKLDTAAESSDETAQEVAQAQKSKLIQAINTTWITVYKELGADKASPLNDDDFVTNHWTAYFARYNQSNARLHLFKEHFTVERIYSGALKASEILDYVKSLQESAILWNKLHHPRFFKAEESEAKEAIQALHKVSFRAHYRTLTLAALRPAHGDRYLKLVRMLEDYEFKMFHVADRQSNTGTKKIYKLAHNVYHASIDCDTACAEIEQHLQWYYQFSRFQNQMHERFNAGEMKGFYRWSGIHYFLFHYDQKLRHDNQTSTKTSELNWKDFKDKDTIEHIYPQSAALSYDAYSEGNDTPKKQAGYAAIQQNWSSFSEYTPEQRRKLCNSLGNLLAISHSDNASFNNDPFLDKVDQTNKGEGYLNRGYKHDSLSAQIVAKKTDWTPLSVKQRGLEMLEALLEMLDEDSSQLIEMDKLKILGIEFLASDPAVEAMSDITTEQREDVASLTDIENVLST
jgi:hypothetical protein